MFKIVNGAIWSNSLIFFSTLIVWNNPESMFHLRRNQVVDDLQKQKKNCARVGFLVKMQVLFLLSSSDVFLTFLLYTHFYL